MRPRVFPAEDGVRRRLHILPLRVASMRPRVFPAEDFYPCTGCDDAGEASMRPRVFPAEDDTDGCGRDQLHPASMRPRVFPAEDSHTMSRPTPASGRCFNEAAGIPRGRPRDLIALRRLSDAASMRPRVFPAEDREVDPYGCNSKRFNEAAGIPRGRRWSPAASAAS